MRIYDEYHKYGLVKVGLKVYQRCDCAPCRGKKEPKPQ